jgi:hypothetical protein
VAERFQDEHPDIEVISASPDQVDLFTDETTDLLGTVREGGPDATDYLDESALIGSAIVAAPIVRDYWSHRIDAAEARRRLIARLGSKVGVMSAKVWLLATPAAPAVIGWSLLRVARALVRLQRSYARA